MQTGHAEQPLGYPVGQEEIWDWNLREAYALGYHLPTRDS